ncbi:heparan-alpha-glucosaminide N-acetyltransferase domain-containing protein [Streptomyces sp. NPDC002306]
MPVPHPLTPVAPSPLPADGRRSAAPRIAGVDTARGLALLGMFAVHVFGAFGDDGSPTWAWTIAGGRSSAAFALLAGVGLAFTTGGPRPVTGPAARGARAAVAARAAVVGLTGLLLGFVSRAADLDVDVILACYALMFLLAQPLLGLPPRTLLALSLALAVTGPVAVLGLGGTLPRPDFAGDPTLVDLCTDPLGLLSHLLVYGNYPVLAWMAYVCAGLAVGRLDLTSRRVAARLLAGGLALAATAWLAATVWLLRLGGLRHLWQAEFSGIPWHQARDEVLWDAPDGATWWSLLSRAPHSTSPFDMLHTLGSAAALLGAVLLLTRSAPVARLLAPLTAAGSMPLTLYSAHVLVLATGVLGDSPGLLYAALATGAPLFAVVWRQARGRGPLETVVAAAARRARAAVTPPVPDRHQASSNKEHMW